MRTARTYGDACGVARALDVVGERWALLVVRELFLGPRRFVDLQGGLPNASPNVLSQRLRELEETGIVRRRRLPPPAAAQVYELTEWGQELEPILVSLALWGGRSPVAPVARRLGVNPLMLAMRATFADNGRRKLEAAVELRLGEEVFCATVAEGRLDLRRGECAAPDAVLEIEPGELQDVVFEGRALGDTGAVLTGDRRTLTKLLSCFRSG